MNLLQTKDRSGGPPEPEVLEPEVQPVPGAAPRAGQARIRAAWAIAVFVDAIQLCTSPLELTGPLDWFLESGADLVTAALMIWLLGFHWAFLPSFVTKLLPFVDLAPTWTAAVFFVTRAGRKPAPGPKP